MAAAGIFDAVLIGFGVKSVKAFSEAQAITAQLNQVLLTTGKNATLSTEQVHKLAMSLEEYSGQTHDAIEQGQTILLQFSGITSKTLPDASKAMVDLAQRMGIDTVSAAKSLGIALDDPEVGMSRLRRAGIDFTEDQKVAIKALKESGDTAGAAAMLMQVLETKIGGAAGAYRNTLAGAVSEAKAKLKDFEEEVGQKLVTALQNAYTWYENHKRIINDVLGVVGTFIGVIATLLILYGNWLLLTKALAAAQVALNILFATNPFVAALTIILILAALVYEHWKKIKEILQPVFDFFDKYINPIVEKLWKIVKDQLIKAWDDLKDSFEKIMQTLKPFYPQLKIIGEILGIALVAPLVLIVAGITAVIVGIVALGVFIARLIGWAAEAIAAFVKWETGFATSIAHIVQSVVKEGGKIIKWFEDLPKKIEDALVNFWQHTLPDFLDNVKNTLERLPYTFGHALGETVKFLINFATVDIPHWWNMVIGWFEALPGKVNKAMTDLVRAIFQDWEQGYNATVDFVVKIFNKVTEWFSKLPGEVSNWLRTTLNSIVDWFSQMPGQAAVAGNNLLNSFINEIARLPRQVASIGIQIINTVAGWATGLFDKARAVANSMWQGFKDGLGIHSPSFIEKALDNIVSASRGTLDQLNTDVAKFANIGVNIGATLPATNNSVAPSTANVTTHIMGDINIGSEVDANSFFRRLTQNQQLAIKGLTPQR